MKTVLVTTTFFFVFFIQFNNVVAQAKVTSVLLQPDTTEIIQYSPDDTLGFQAGKIKLVSNINAKSGNLAMLLSAVLPGAGQVYAHRYYTIPLIWGCGVYFGSQWISANNFYKDYQDKFSESVRLDTTTHTGIEGLKKARDEWRNYRDGFAVYLVLTYFLNIIDAYVGATLYSFDVSDDLGGSAALKFRIPLR